MFTALVYITTSISFPMPQPLGVWHMRNLVAFLTAILCGPHVGTFVCAVGAGLFDIWNPLWGSRFIIYAPATFVIRGLMGFLVGEIAWTRRMDPGRSGLMAMIVGHIEKNVGHFPYDYCLFGAASLLDLFTLFPKSIIEIVFTIGLLTAIRRTLGETYLL